MTGTVTYTSKNDSDICSCRLGDNGLLEQATFRHSYPPWKASFLQIAWRSNFNSVMLHIRRCSLLSQLKACAFAISQSNSYLPVHWLFKFCSCVITSRSNENHSAVSYHYQDTLRQKSTLFECQRIWQKSTNWNLELTLRTPFLHLLQWMTLLLYVVIWPCEGLAIFRAN